MKDIRDTMPLVFIGERAYYVIRFNPGLREAELLTQHGFKFIAPFAALSATPTKGAK